jgi:hypothetical protein
VINFKSDFKILGDKGLPRISKGKVSNLFSFIKNEKSYLTKIPFIYEQPLKVRKRYALIESTILAHWRKEKVGLRKKKSNKERKRKKRKEKVGE